MTQTTKAGKESWIPEVPEERIRELAERISPVVRMARFRTTIKKHADGSVTITKRKHPQGKLQPTRNKEGELYYIEPVAFDVDYMRDPKPWGTATGLKPFYDITTYHTHGSIAEVLAQIPAEHLDMVVAFEIMDSPPENADDLNRENKALNAGYRVTTTRLYTWFWLYA